MRNQGITGSNADPGRGRKQSAMALAVAAVLAVATGEARADFFQGTVEFQGAVSFSAPVPGIDSEDVTVSVTESTEATDGGEKCEILTRSSDNADLAGDYPDTGNVNAEILMTRGGGPQFPDGECIVTLKANGTDGVSKSARGTRTVFVAANDVNGGATLVGQDITLRESKAIAALDKECFKWVKKTLKKRAKCNFLILKKGGAIAVDKCKDAGFPEPADCDPGDNSEAILALSHGINDQQTDPGSGEAVDLTVLNEQVKCQKFLGKAAVNFAIKRMKLVDKKCVQALADSESCRDDQSKDSKKKLDKIDKCIEPQDTDGGTGRIVPDVDAPCDTCIDGGTGDIDRKCMKGCFQLAVDELSDNIVGDTPVCGNGIIQPPEFCDDGNVADGDCCSSSCEVEPNPGDQTCGVGACEVTVPICQLGVPVICVPDTPSTEGPNGDATCTDGIDNDCDGDTDGADTDCL